MVSFVKNQGGMAILREYRKPDLFITMTCNPKWPEIQDHIKEGHKSQDRPDLVARAFKLKKDQLMRGFIDGQHVCVLSQNMPALE